MENWRLEEIKIGFEQGYSFKNKPEEREDRYEGFIRFKNGEKEEFKFKITPDMSQKYIDLIAEDIVKHANDLGDKLIKSLGLKNNR